jgi:hypothetical protein
VLTVLVFDLFGAADRTARVIPAIVGVLLVAVPPLLRGRVGAGRAALVALLLAISPTLVASSRSAHSGIIAALGLTLLLVSLIQARGEKIDLWLRGIAIGVALAAGPSVWFGLGTILIAWAVASASSRFADRLGAIELDWPPDPRTLLLGLLVAVLIASGAGISLTSLGAIFTSLSDWLSGWSPQTSIHPLTILAASLAYEPLVWLLGLIGAALCIRNRDRIGTASASWAMGAMLMIIVYPGRRPEDIIWIVIPFTYLGAVAIDAIVQGTISARARTGVLALSLAVVLLAAFAFLQIRVALQGRFAGLEFAGLSMEFLLPTLAVLLAVALSILFGMGWSWREALVSVALSGAVFAAVLSVSALTRLSFGESAAGAQELWRPQVSTEGIPLMLQTLELASEAETGFGDAVSVQVMDQIPGALAWALRDYGRPSSDQLLVGHAPVAALTPATALPESMGEAYIGQTLAVSERWGWDGVLPPEVSRWLVLGDAPVVQDRWILMVRADVFGAAE